MAAGLVVLALAAASPRVSAAPVLGASELEAAAAEVRAGRAKAGRLVGRRFRILVTPRETGPANSLCDGFPAWNWDAGGGAFELSADSAGQHLRFFLGGDGNEAVPADGSPHGAMAEWVQITSFACRVAREPKRMVTNMYGETVEHEPVREDVVAIARFGSRIPAAWLRVPTDEAGARVLGARIAVRLTGVIGEWAPGRSIVCGADDFSALGSPVFVEQFSGCLINGRVQRIDYVDRTTGEVRLSGQAAAARDVSQGGGRWS